jgi:hypothetical protein
MIKSFQNLALAIALILVGTLIFPDLAQAGELGGVNMDTYCRTNFGWDFVTAELGEHTAWGWYCYADRSGSHEIDVGDACRQQYSNPNAYARAKNPNDPYSWVCISD